MASRWLLPWEVCALACADLDVTLPYPLANARQLPHDADTDPDAWRRRAHKQAERQGWRTQGGRWDDELAEVFQVLCRSWRAVTGIATLGTTTLTARVGFNGQVAARATAEPDGLELDRVRSTAWIPAIISLIPDSRPGTSAETSSFPANANQADRVDDATTSPVLSPVYAHPTSQQRRVNLARSITAQARHRAGALTAHARPRREREIHSRTLGWFDTPTGRYAVLTDTADDGTDWITYFPADNHTLTTRLTELSAALKAPPK